MKKIEYTIDPTDEEDILQLKYKNVAGEEVARKFKRTIEVASMFEGANAKAMIKLYLDLTKQGITMESLIIHSTNPDGTKVEDHTNLDALEKKYKEIEQSNIILEIVQKLFGIGIDELCADMGITEGKDVQMFVLKLCTSFY